MELKRFVSPKFLALLFGKRSFNAFGLTRVEVSIKKIKSRNTISVMEDILKSGLTLFLLLSTIIQNDEYDLKIQLFWLPFGK